MKYLLDTNAWISYLRSTSTGIIDKLSNLPRADVFLCSIVLTELRFGVLLATGKRAVQNASSLNLLEKNYTSLVFDDAAATDAAAIKLELRKQGNPLGEYDLLIAAIARVNKLTLVTHNTGEFSRIPNLLIEDWQV